MCVSDPELGPADHPSPRACSLGPREHSPTAARPARRRGAGLGQQPFHPPPGRRGAGKVGCAWAPHLVGLGWGHQQTSDHGQHTQELHASRAFTGPARSPTWKRNTRAAKGRMNTRHPRPRSEPACSGTEEGGGWAWGPGPAKPGRSGASLSPGPRSPTAHRAGSAAGPPGREGGSRVSGTRLAGDPCLASPRPPPLPPAAPPPGRRRPWGSESPSPDPTTRPRIRDPRDPRTPATPRPLRPLPQRAPANLQAPPRRHKTRLAPPLTLLLAAGATAQHYLAVSKATWPASAAAPRLRAREREAFLNPTKQEKGASAKRKSSGRGLASLRQQSSTAEVVPCSI